MVEVGIAGFCLVVIVLGLIYYCRSRSSAKTGQTAAPKPDTADATWQEDGHGGWTRTNADSSPIKIPVSSPLGASPSTNRWTAHDGNEYQATAI